jgi:hypothetical protein
MTAFGWSLVELSARLLKSDEREFVLGDLAEDKENAWRGLYEVLGLFFRQQLLLWRDARPWVAGFLVAWPASHLLMHVSISVTSTYERLVYHRIFLENPHPGHEGFVLLVCHVLLLVAWSWAAGYVVGSMSRRTVLVSAALGIAACNYTLGTMCVDWIPKLCLFLFVPPALAGMWHGLRQTLRITQNVAAILAMSVTALMTIASLSHALWCLNWALIWPAWYLVATARRPVSGTFVTMAEGNAG